MEGQISIGLIMRSSILTIVSRCLSLNLMLLMGCTGLDPVSEMNLEGNRLFESGDFEAALKQYKEAQLENKEEVSELHFNAGDAHYKQEGYEDAFQEFGRVLSMEDTSLTSEAFYNLGNTLFRQEKFQEAAEAFKKSLAFRSEDLDAKINLEMTLEKLKEQQQKENQENRKPPEPSDYAKDLKEQAEALVTQYRYRQAHDLMTEGLKIDSTVGSFQEFINRIKDIVDIEGMVL